MYTAKKNAASPTSYKGINYFNHFPRQRLLPYGAIKEPTPDSSMLDKAKSIKCEYIKRPKVGLSELADTVSSNKDRIKHVCANLDHDEIATALDQLDDAIHNFIVEG